MYRELSSSLFKELYKDDNYHLYAILGQSIILTSEIDGTSLVSIHFAPSSRYGTKNHKDVKSVIAPYSNGNQEDIQRFQGLINIDSQEFELVITNLNTEGNIKLDIYKDNFDDRINQVNVFSSFESYSVQCDKKNNLPFILQKFRDNLTNDTINVQRNEIESKEKKQLEKGSKFFISSFPQKNIKKLVDLYKKTFWKISDIVVIRVDKQKSNQFGMYYQPHIQPQIKLYDQQKIDDLNKLNELLQKSTEEFSKGKLKLKLPQNDTKFILNKVFEDYDPYDIPEISYVEFEGKCPYESPSSFWYVFTDPRQRITEEDIERYRIKREKERKEEMQRRIWERESNRLHRLRYGPGSYYSAQEDRKMGSCGYTGSDINIRGDPLPPAIAPMDNSKPIINEEIIKKSDVGIVTYGIDKLDVKGMSTNIIFDSESPSKQCIIGLSISEDLEFIHIDISKKLEELREKCIDYIFDINNKKYDSFLKGKIYDSETCAICLDDNLDCVLYSCGHKCGHYECMMTYTKCPMCSKYIIAKLKQPIDITV